MTGPLKSQIPLVHQCVLIIPGANYEWSSHSGLPAIRSLQCAQEGIHKSQDGVCNVLNVMILGEVVEIAIQVNL